MKLESIRTFLSTLLEYRGVRITQTFNSDDGKTLIVQCEPDTGGWSSATCRTAWRGNTRRLKKRRSSLTATSIRKHLKSTPEQVCSGVFLSG
ncbi:hypothetical protein [Planococcus plakortidis]|uniref:hypothetical protein n=1 Tax=Planococcus plakortidis TaxID=1038856 RepID=UPI0012ED6CC2|nr:hypothetical protein [Planococcus plakortidis]